eukprot:gene27641-7279_t
MDSISHPAAEIVAIALRKVIKNAHARKNSTLIEECKLFLENIHIIVPAGPSRPSSLTSTPQKESHIPGGTVFDSGGPSLLALPACGDWPPPIGREPIGHPHTSPTNIPPACAKSTPENLTTENSEANQDLEGAQGSEQIPEGQDEPQETPLTEAEESVPPDLIRRTASALSDAICMVSAVARCD